MTDDNVVQFPKRSKRSPAHSFGGAKGICSFVQTRTLFGEYVLDFERTDLFRNFRKSTWYFPTKAQAFHHIQCCLNRNELLFLDILRLLPGGINFNFHLQEAEEDDLEAILCFVSFVFGRQGAEVQAVEMRTPYSISATVKRPMPTFGLEKPQLARVPSELLERDLRQLFYDEHELLNLAFDLHPYQVRTVSDLLTLDWNSVTARMTRRSRKVLAKLAAWLEGYDLTLVEQKPFQDENVSTLQRA